MQLDKIIMKEGMVDAYWEIADAVDKSAGKTEEVMLFHKFDHDPCYQQKFVSAGVFRKSEDFFFVGIIFRFKRTQKSRRSWQCIFLLRFMVMYPMKSLRKPTH